MNQLYKVFVAVCLLSVMAQCDPRVVSKSTSSTLLSRVNLDYEPFVMMEKDTIDRSIYKPIGQVKIKDSGLTLDCDYETIKDFAKAEALKLGGNCLVITKHQKPDYWSTCDRINADVFFIKNIKDFETEIIWSEKRKLTIEDFKASIEKRPSIAATMSSFRYFLHGRPLYPNRYKVVVKTYFICNLSYFKHTDSDSSVLAHEQVHFDITELYARKFLERLQKEVKTLAELEAKQNFIAEEIYAEIYKKQDEYDSEVYEHESKQAKWSAWVKEELEKYKAYSGKILNVNKYKQK